MDVVALALAALLAIACVLFVARPFLRHPAHGDDVLAEPDEADAERLRLVEERDRALGALKELEFDHRTGAISDSDYRELVGPLRRQAADALAALEPGSGPRVRGGNRAAGRVENPVRDQERTC